jgi:hypothetical protein
MNQKILRYGLIGGVTLVWGLIIYRVVDGLGDDDALPFVKSAVVKADVLEKEPEKFTLIADYPDPFIPGGEGEDTAALVSTVPGAGGGAPVPVYTPPVEVYKEGTIKYLGMIANPAKKMKVAVIQVNGKEMTVKEKDRIEEFVVRKIERERLVVVWKGKEVVVRR